MRFILLLTAQLCLLLVLVPLGLAADFTTPQNYPVGIQGCRDYFRADTRAAAFSKHIPELVQHELALINAEGDMDYLMPYWLEAITAVTSVSTEDGAALIAAFEAQDLPPPPALYLSAPQVALSQVMDAIEAHGEAHTAPAALAAWIGQTPERLQTWNRAYPTISLKEKTAIHGLAVFNAVMGIVQTQLWQSEQSYEPAWDSALSQAVMLVPSLKALTHIPFLAPEHPDRVAWFQQPLVDLVFDGRYTVAAVMTAALSLDRDARSQAEAQVIRFWDAHGLANDFGLSIAERQVEMIGAENYVALALETPKLWASLFALHHYATSTWRAYGNKTIGLEALWARALAPDYIQFANHVGRNIIANEERELPSAQAAIAELEASLLNLTLVENLQAQGWQASFDQWKVRIRDANHISPIAKLAGLRVLGIHALSFSPTPEEAIGKLGQLKKALQATSLRKGPISDYGYELDYYENVAKYGDGFDPALVNVVLRHFSTPQTSLAARIKEYERGFSLNYPNANVIPIKHMTKMLISPSTTCLNDARTPLY